MKYIIWTVTLCSTTLFTLGCTRYSSVTTETYAIPQNSTVAVSTFNGSITVEWYEGSDMILEITKTSNRSEDEFDKAEVMVSVGMLTNIEARRLDRHACIGVSLVLQLPYGSEISDLETSNGRIAVTGGAGSANVHTSNGSISFEDFEGSVSAETSNGSINVSGSSIIYASSSNGGISGVISSIPPEGIVLLTSNGAIQVEIDSELDADFEMDTSNGSITVNGEGFSNVYIHDSDGSATLGTGGNPVTLRTSNGSIRITAI